MSRLEAHLVEEIRHRLGTGFPAQVRAALLVMGEGEIWARANEKANSVGNLVLHLCGSSRHFLGRLVGGSDYVRDRPAEFAEKGPLPREALLRLLEETVAEHERVLGSLDPGRLLETREMGGGKSATVAALLLRVSHHWAVHAGQIVFQAKALHPEAFDELWMKTMERRS
jgi:uncharacterized damage-inducible protein DinB